MIICHFHLNLQRNAHPNSNTSQPTISIWNFQAASQRMHDAVMAEFGGSLVAERVEAEASADEMVTLDPDMSLGMMGNVIELEEFQSQPQPAERMPGSSVSLAHM